MAGPFVPGSGSDSPGGGSPPASASARHIAAQSAARKALAITHRAQSPDTPPIH